MADNPKARPPARLAGWQFQRGSDVIRFQMELDPSDFTEKLILSHFDARSFYEAEVSGLMIKVLQKGDEVYDIGANCGYFTVLASALIGEGGHVLAIEPAPDCIARLDANIARNVMGNVTALERVATNRVGETKFHLNSDNSGGHALWDPGEWPDNRKSRENPSLIVAEATTLDVEWKKRGFVVPKLIKIDTEGAEQFVLEGARELLTGCKVPFVVVELQEFGLNRLGCTQESMRRVMEELGYSTFGLFYSGALPRFVPPGTRIESRFLINILFATPAAIAQYWQAAPHDPRGIS